MAETAIGALAVRIAADIGDFVKGLDKADRAVDKFSKQVDKRLLDPLTKITAAAGAAGAAIFAFTKSAADSVDQIEKMGQKVGMAVDRLSGLKYAAEVNDVAFDSLGQGLKQLSKFMVENQITGVGVEEQLMRIADEFSRTADNENKTAAAMKYFGKSGADMIPLLNQGRAGIEELRKEAEKLGVVFDKEAARAADEFNDNLTRLKAAATGLQVHFAGDFVNGLNKAAQAMLDAKKEGESLFTVLINGFRTLVTGDDAHKWNVEFTKATERLLEAQNTVDRLKAKGGTGLANISELVKAQRDLAAAQAEIERLRAIKPVLAPEKEKEKEEEKTDSVVVPEDASKAQAARDLLAKQLEEQLEEEIKVQSETAQLMADQRAMELEKERLIRKLYGEAFLEDAATMSLAELQQIDKQGEERIKILIAQYDAEQEAAIEAGEKEIEIAEETERRKKQIRSDQLRGTQQFLGNLASLTNTSSRKMFEIGKVAAIAEGGVRAALATMEAWEFGNKIGGPVVGATFAAAAALAGLNYLNNIRNQTFGGGGGAPTPTGQGASGVAAPVQSAAPGPERGPDTVIHLHGETFGRTQLRALIEQINEEGRDGGRIILAGS